MSNFHMKNFEITYFNGPTADYVIKEEVIADIAKSGMTLMPLHYGTETNKQVLPILRKYGLKANVSDPRIHGLYYTDDLAAADATVKEIVADYADFDNIIGWDIIDEPSAAKFPVLAAIVRAFRRYSPDKETTINLFPNYAVPEQLGNPDYPSHLEAFVNIVDPHLLSYDHYHFLGRQLRKSLFDDGTVDERERMIREAAVKTEDRGGFFDNIEVVREIALKYDIDPMLIVLLVEHGIYRYLTYGELLWEVNMCLAYGMKRLSYFTYWLPVVDGWAYEHAMCDTEGNKDQHWYDVQKINAAVTPAGRHLFATTSTAVFHIGTPEDTATKFTAYGDITAIDGENGVVGFFADGSVYLVNRDFISENTFTVHTDKKLTRMENGIFVDAESNTFTLGAGEAVLLKV